MSSNAPLREQQVPSGATGSKLEAEALDPVDAASADSFPASDPPQFWGRTAPRSSGKDASHSKQ